MLHGRLAEIHHYPARGTKQSSVIPCNRDICRGNALSKRTHKDAQIFIDQETVAYDVARLPGSNGKYRSRTNFALDTFGAEIRREQASVGGIAIAKAVFPQYAIQSFAHWSGKRLPLRWAGASIATETQR